MKILIVGGTGHVGTHLTPMLVKRGHDVYVGTRGVTNAKDGAFEGAKLITVNAKDMDSIRALREYNFDTVIDFPGTAYNLWGELKDNIGHLIACGSLWMYGYPHIVPTPELLNPTEEAISQGYIMRFGQIKEMLAESGKCKAVFTAIMPPNICGPGKIPLDFLCDRSAENHMKMMRGEEVVLPDGPEALIGPCDAEDIASLFALAAENRCAAAGEMFNVGSAYSIPFTDFIKAYADIYGSEIPIRRVPWAEYIRDINPNKGDWWHYYADMLPDISKARRLLGYEPKYTPEDAVRRAVEWMLKEGIIHR